MVRLDWLRRETYDHPDNHPWTASPEQTGQQEADDVLAEEEFEYQTALAISASQSADEARTAQAQQDAAELDSITRRSLTPLVSGRSTGQADALSYKLWDSDCLNYDDLICDGVYDVRGDFPELCIGGAVCFPTLADVRGIRPESQDTREDPGLCAVDERAADAISSCIKDGPVACIQALAQVVANQLGGRCSYAELSQRYPAVVADLKSQRHTLALPIGALRVGLARHRSLLFKSLADASELPCRLLRGRFYLGQAGTTGDAAIVMVRVNGREMMVDLVANPGTVFPVVPDSIPQAIPPPGHAATSTSSPSLGTPAGLDGFDGDMEGPDLIPIREDEPGSQEWSMVSSADAVQQQQGPPSGQARTQHSSSDHSSCTLPDPTANGSGSPVTSWVNTGLSSPSPFEATGLQSEAFQTREPPSNASAASTMRMEPEHVQPPLQTSVTSASDSHPASSAAASEITRSFPRLSAGRGAESAFHEFGSSAGSEHRRALITQAMNGVKRRPALPRHSLSDLSPASMNHLSPHPEPAVGSIPENADVPAYAPASQSGHPPQQEPSGQQQAGNANTTAVRSPGKPPPHRPRSPARTDGGTESFTLEPLRNRPPQGDPSDDRALSHAQASSSGQAPHLQRVSPAVRLTEVSAIPKASLHDQPINSAQAELDEWEIEPEEIELGPRIGIGSYGEVYRGIWRHTDVAVKRLLEQDLTAHLMDEFKAEVSIMKRLKHPNIVLFMGACTKAPNLSIVTQFVPRGSLFRLLHRTPQVPLDERRKTRMALDVAKGMNYLHSCRPPIVHRDLKSPNLLVDKDFTVKVCDFGLSRVRQSTWMSNKSQAGTPEWTAPEVLRSQSYNEKSDVYSMGVILWELLTNEEPWGDKTAMQVVGAVGWGNARLPMPENVPEAMRSLILHCWAEPAQRPSFSDIIGALNALDH